MSLPSINPRCYVHGIRHGDGRVHKIEDLDGEQTECIGFDDHPDEQAVEESEGDEVTDEDVDAAKRARLRHRVYSQPTQAELDAVDTYLGHTYEHNTRACRGSGCGLQDVSEREHAVHVIALLDSINPAFQMQPDWPPVQDDPSVFIGSNALMSALYDTYREHVGITETDGPDGPYIGCVCGFRTDDDTIGDRNPGLSYAMHLVKAQHDAAVAALQPLVKRVTS